MMTMSQISLAGALVLSLASGAGASQADRPQRGLERCQRPKSVRVTKQYLVNAVWAAMDVFKSTAPNVFKTTIPYGWIDYDVANLQYPQMKFLTLNFRACSLEDALNRIVAASGGDYRWVHDGGAINLIPTIDPSGLGVARQLEQTVNRFEVRAVDIDAAFVQLVEQMEAQSIQGFWAGRYHTVVESPNNIEREPHKVTLSLTNKTVRQCLNAIAVARGAGAWTARPGKDGKIWISPSRFSMSDRPVKFSQEEFLKYVTMTDRLAELRGVDVVRGLTPQERQEHDALLAEYMEFMQKHTGEQPFYYYGREAPRR